MKTDSTARGKSWSVPGFCNFSFVDGLPGWGVWRLAVFLFLALFVGLVQAATYSYRNQAFAYDTPSAGATTVAWHASGASPACTSYPNGDDDWADVSFPGGFTFTFGGTNYAGVRIYSNGILAFGNDVSGYHRDYTPQALPITGQAASYTGCPRGVPVNLMLPYWIDIVAGTANSTAGASVKHEILGTAPNRRFVISWDNVKLYNTSTRYNFQVVLYESATGVNGYFEYRYTSGSSTGADATVGVQLSTTDYTQYSYDQQFIDTTNGTSIFWYPANQLATKGAEYRFDEGVWTGGAGEVKDTSGNSQDAQRLGNASNIADGKLCRGGSFTNNTSNATIDAVATPVVPGNSGSVSFWYRSNNRWNTADTMLFDATAVANRPFFLMKRSNGRLRFAVAASNGTTVTAETGNLSYAASSWQHIGVTWNVRTGTNQTLVQIYINGNLVTFARGTTNGTMPALGSLHIGDNRTSGVTPSNGTSNGANGTIDEFYIYPTDVSGPQFEADMNLTRPTCTALDHFRVVHDGTAACGAAQVTIEAHDANHALFDLAGTTMTVSTSTGHGTWSAVSAINPVTNIVPGTATYTFANENRIVLSLNNAYAETVNINVASGTITEHSGAAATCTAADYTYGTICDADLVFGPCVSNFECLEAGLAYNNLTTSPTARNPLYTKLAGTGFSFDVVALDADGNRVSNYATDTDQAVTVELVDASGGGACASLLALSPAVSTTLTFTKAGQPTDQGRKTVGFTVNRAHANLRCRVTDANQTPNVKGCSSDSFAIRPQSFVITSMDANADATGTSATATPRIKAGNNFSLTATAVAGYDGTPQIDNGLVSDHNGAARSVSGSFGPGNSAGIAIGSAFVYDEVGYFRFAAAGVYDNTFAAIDYPSDCTDDFSNTAVGGQFGCKFGNVGPTDYFGRFYPDHFGITGSVTNRSDLVSAGGSFTYMGEPMRLDLSVTAYNTNDGVTTNYRDAFARLDAATLSADDRWFTTGCTGSTQCFGLGAVNAATGLSGRLGVVGAGVYAGVLAPTSSWTAGVGTFVVNVRMNRKTLATDWPDPPTSVLDGPYDALRFGAMPRDSDGVTLPGPASIDAHKVDFDATTGDTLNSHPDGTHERRWLFDTGVRFGRLRLVSGQGSQHADYLLRTEAQYWNGSAWVTNTLDSLTPLAADNFAITGAGTIIDAGNIDQGFGSVRIRPSGTGVADVCLGAGAAGTGACAAANPAELDYLLGNWSDAAFDDDPGVRVTFGQPQQKSRANWGFIYRRENY